MKPFYFLPLLLYALFSSEAFAQSRTDAKIYEIDKYDHLLKTDATLAVNNNGNNIDIKYHRFNLVMNPDISPATITGSVTTYFVTTVANVNRIKFDLYNSGMDGDSFQYHGVSYALTEATHHIVDTLIINLPVTIVAAGTLDSVTVFYHGTPLVNGASRGYHRNTTSGSSILSTHSSGYFARQWWPCKHTLGDKIDSVDIVVTSPSAYRVAATGMLQNTNPPTVSGNRTWWWKTTYPVAHYLIAIAVHPYVIHNSPPAIIGGTSVPITNYLTTAINTAATRNACDAMKGAMEYFSTVFGEYPFKNERYGHVAYTFGGGMENQTASFIGTGAFNGSLLAHELAHQWFGDNVTCDSWNNIWVNEGFARYAEILYAEYLAGNTSGGNTLRAGYKTGGQSATGIVYRYDTEVITPADHTGKIFVSSMVYDKASIVISMLRKLLGDADFFQALRNYQSIDSLNYGNASTEDVKHHFESVSGLDLDSFFDDFIYQQGYPIYSLSYQPSASAPYKVAISYTQSKSSGSPVSYYNTVLPVRFRNVALGRDTIVYIFDEPALQGTVLQYNLSFPVTSVQVDPLSEAYTYSPTVTLSGVTLLPVTLSYFNADKVSNEAVLRWSAETTGIFSHFEIERSTDGTKFTRLADIFPVEGLSHYSYTDKVPGAGKNYYRLKMVDKENSHSYSNVTILDFSRKVKVQIAPNPSSGIFSIVYTDTQLSQYQVRLINPGGQVFIPKIISSVTGKVEIDARSVPDGLYWVEMKNPSGVKRLEKIIIKH